MIEFARQFVSESALIEGQVIPKDQLDASGHLHAYLYAIGLADAKDMIQEGDLRNIQAMIARGQHKWGDRLFRADEVGIYRRHEIGISQQDGSVKEIGAAWDNIPKKMKELKQTIWNWTLFVPEVDDALTYAGTVHWTFERIHPFPDGNGRTGRIIAAYMLRMMGADPVLFTNSDKHETYYPCFEEPRPDKMIEYFKTHQVTNAQSVAENVKE